MNYVAAVMGTLGLVTQLWVEWREYRRKVERGVGGPFLKLRKRNGEER